MKKTKHKNNANLYTQKTAQIRKNIQMIHNRKSDMPKAFINLRRAIMF